MNVAERARRRAPVATRTTIIDRTGALCDRVQPTTGSDRLRGSPLIANQVATFISPIFHSYLENVLEAADSWITIFYLFFFFLGVWFKMRTCD